MIQRWLLGLVAEPSKQSKIIVIKKLKDNGTSKQGSSLWKMGLIVDEFLLASVGMWSNSPWRRYHYADIKVWLGRTTLVCYDVWNVPNVVVEWCEFYNRVESLLYILIRFIYDVYWGLYIYIIMHIMTHHRDSYQPVSKTWGYELRGSTAEIGLDCLMRLKHRQHFANFA